MGSGKNWTSEEIAYVEERWGATSIPRMAKHLGRSVNAVKLKAGRMGLGRHLHSGTRITLLQFCEAIGKKNSYGWIKDRWVRLGLPVHYQKSITKRYAMVDIDEFWVWAEQHKDLIDFDAFTEGTFRQRSQRKVRATAKPRILQAVLPQAKRGDARILSKRPMHPLHQDDRLRTAENKLRCLHPLHTAEAG